MEFKKGQMVEATHFVSTKNLTLSPMIEPGDKLTIVGVYFLEGQWWLSFAQKNYDYLYPAKYFKSIEKI